MRSHLLLVHVLVLSLVSTSISHAETSPSTMPHLTETTRFQISRSVQGGPLSESLTCDLATTRALAQLTNMIQRERTAQRITSDELALALPPNTLHTWDATSHQCRVTVRIEIPVLPRPLSTRSIHEITRGFVLHIDHR